MLLQTCAKISILWRKYFLYIFIIFTRFELLLSYAVIFLFYTAAFIFTIRCIIFATSPLFLVSCMIFKMCNKYFMLAFNITSKI